MMGLPYGEEIMIVGRTMWTQSTSVTDRRTDRQTDRQTDRIIITDTVQRIASHGKNWVNIRQIYCNNKMCTFLRTTMHVQFSAYEKSSGSLAVAASQWAYSRMYNRLT